MEVFVLLKWGFSSLRICVTLTGFSKYFFHFYGWEQAPLAWEASLLALPRCEHGNYCSSVHCMPLISFFSNL